MYHICIYVIIGLNRIRIVSRLLFINSREKETTIISPAHPSIFSAAVRSLPSIPCLGEVDILAFQGVFLPDQISNTEQHFLLKLSWFLRSLTRIDWLWGERRLLIIDHIYYVSASKIGQPVILLIFLIGTKKLTIHNCYISKLLEKILSNSS